MGPARGRPDRAVVTSEVVRVTATSSRIEVDGPVIVMV